MFSQFFVRTAEVVVDVLMAIKVSAYPTSAVATFVCSHFNKLSFQLCSLKVVKVAARIKIPWTPLCPFYIINSACQFPQTCQFMSLKLNFFCFKSFELV